MNVKRYQGSAPDALEWYSTDCISAVHGMFTRSGGVSVSPFAGFNLSFAVGDVPDAVRENRQQLKKCLGLEYLVSAGQVHGDRLAVVEDIGQDTELTGYDGLITSQPGVGLLIQQADCQAVLIHDPVEKVVAAVHSGWRGSTLNISGKTVTVMEKNFGVNPADLRVVISPSLGPCCAEFSNYRLELPRLFHTWQVKPCYFDFWAITRSQLTAAGVMEKNIVTAAICTECSKDFFSYRRAVKRGNGITGRNGSVIALP